MSSHTLTIDPERALPSAVYRDPAVLAAEMRGIWRGDWVFATTVDALASPGDQLPVVIGDQPVLLLRNQQGELAALSNLCAHRGTLCTTGPTIRRRRCGTATGSSPS
ncbi:MAG: Rieske 2Fe-2S domain-containing protein [bacterium]|nr:Rieske 2Fe-2S domain-containing protein [bacterium]